MNDRMVAARGFATMSSSIESADNYVAWMLGKFLPFFGTQLLEIGTGWGNFRRHIPPVELFVSVDLDEKIAAGEFRPLLDWLRENIHRHGQRYTATELVRVVTGESLSHKPFMAYLTGKFKPLYGI